MFRRVSSWASLLCEPAWLKSPLHLMEQPSITLSLAPVILLLQLSHLCETNKHSSDIGRIYRKCKSDTAHAVVRLSWSIEVQILALSVCSSYTTMNNLLTLSLSLSLSLSTPLSISVRVPVHTLCSCATYWFVCACLCMHVDTYAYP